LNGTARAVRDAMDEIETTKWREVMTTVLERKPLEEVVRWWCDVWEWRTELLNKGEGTPYDGHPSYRVPWSMVVSKFPWLNVQDRIDIAPLMTKEMKLRSKTSNDWKAFYTAYRKEIRHFNSKR
jgi:hypothetical protein